MELIKIVDARKVIDGFANTMGISAKVAYKMTKFMAKTESEHAFYIAEIHKLVDKHATKNDNGDSVIPPDHIDEFNDAAEKINKTDVEDPMIRFDLDDLAELNLSMKQMYPLLDFINEE